MNRSYVQSLAMAFGVFGFAVQGGAQNHAQAGMLIVPVSSDCQVGMRVQQQTNGAVLPANAQAKSDTRLHLTLTNSKAVGIVNAEVIVFGSSAKGGFAKLRSANVSSNELSKTVHLQIKVPAEGEASTDLRLAGFNVVRMVDIAVIEYADGTRWESSASKTCHVTPDGKLLISSR